MKQMALATALVVALLTSALGSVAFYSSTSANPSGELPLITMPIEYVNYTIADVDGELWAKINGTYPINLIKTGGSSFNGVLPIAYPMPPNTKNIHVTVDDKELDWTTTDSQLHQTAISNWSMIYCSIDNVQDSFMLKIHYEHPIEKVNASYIFLYDLNISPYLSTESPQSTAYFAFRFQTNISDVHVYTAPPESSQSQWQGKDFTMTEEGSFEVVFVEMHSRYDEALTGDIAVVFAAADESPVNQTSSFDQPKYQGDNALTWIMPVVVDVFLITAVLFVKRKTVTSVLSSRKKATQRSTQV